MEYTRGEWGAKKNALGTWTIQTDLEYIGQMDRHYNAHLIASAPKGYEANKVALSFVDALIKQGEDLARDYRVQMVRTTLAEAIAKAEGND